jgi:hypothetical protein
VAGAVTVEAPRCWRPLPALPLVVALVVVVVVAVAVAVAVVVVAVAGAGAVVSSVRAPLAPARP